MKMKKWLVVAGVVAFGWLAFHWQSGGTSQDVSAQQDRQVQKSGSGRIADAAAALRTKAASLPKTEKLDVSDASLSGVASGGIVQTSVSLNGSGQQASSSSRTAALGPNGCPQNYPTPTKEKLIGAVVDYRSVRLPPTEKGGEWGELREWLIDRGEGRYPSHIEEEYRPDDTGALVLKGAYQYAAHHAMVRIDGECSLDEFRTAMKRSGLSVKDPIFKFKKGAQLVLVSSDSPATLDTFGEIRAFVAAYRADFTAERDYHHSVSLVPDDSYYSTQWALPKISAPNAWSTRNDASSVVVAVDDTGIKYNHVDLSGNMWRNPKPGSIISGLTGDTYGIKCIDGTWSNDPMDDNGHGTHCAGIIGAVGNNSKGVAGVCWKVKLMAVKHLDSTGSGWNSDSIRCMAYAALAGADVISCSFGGNGRDSDHEEVISTLRDIGIIVVCSAGNAGVNTDTTPQYPSAYTLDNIVSVAATDSDDTLCTRAKNGWSGGSNYGASSVDIAAPGDKIRSTVHSSTTAYDYKSGTSMAAPFVSGAIALIKAQYPNETYLQTIQRLYNGGDALSGLSGKIKTGKRLNLYKSLQGANLSAPTGVSATRGTHSDKVVVSWSSVSGATHYHVYRATSSTGSKSSVGSWQSSTSYSDTSVTPGTTYYYWVTAASSSSGAKESSYSSSASGYAQAAVLDSWDPGDDTASGATSLTLSTTVQTHGTHTLSGNDTYDFFKIVMLAGRTYTFESSGTGDTYAELFSSASADTSSRVAYNDDGAGSSQFKITYTPSSAGTYYLRVRCHTLGGSAQYSLKYSMTEAGDAWDPGDDTASGGTIITPASTFQTHGPHTLSSTDRCDFFKVSLTAGRKYTFESTSLTGDVVGELYSSFSVDAANQVAYNDDGGDGYGKNFKIEYTPTMSATYYLRVRVCADNGSSATYTLRYKYEDESSYDIVFLPITSYRNWPEGQGSLISLSTNDLSSPVTQFKTTDTAYFYLGWCESNAQRFPESMYTTMAITRQNSTNVLASCQIHWKGGINSGYTGNPWSVSGFPAGAYTVTYKLNENRAGQRIISESNYDNNIRKINFTVVEEGKELSSVAISGNVNVPSKGSASYRCMATYTDRSTSEVTPTWTVTSGGAYASISAGGMLTASSVTVDQAVTISASYGGKTATKKVTILADGSDPEKSAPFGDVVVYPSAPMVVEAQVLINDDLAEEGDVVAAFGGDEVRGIGTVASGGRVTMAVYVASAKETISFKAFDASEGDEGRVYPCMQSFQCDPGETKGTAAEPVVLTFTDNDPFGDVQLEPTVPTVIEAQVTIDDMPAASGDILGVFSGEKLVGKQVISYKAPETGGDRSPDPIAYCSVVLFVSGSQTLTFKVWDASEQKLFGCDNTLPITGGAIVGTTESRYLVEAVSFNEDNTPCDVTLPNQGWNLVSFSVLPEGATPGNVFDSIKGSIRYVSSGTSLWSPTSGGNLTQISIGAGYWVNRSTDSTVSWTVEGTGAPDTEIRLTEGWNLIGYTLPRAGYVQNVLATALAAGKIRYIVYGKSLYPNGGLTTMGPGLGYWVMASGAYVLKFDHDGMMTAANSAAAMRAQSSSSYGPFTEEVKVDPGVPTILTDISFTVHGKPLAVGDCVALYADTGDLYAVARMEDETSKLTMPLFANGGKNMHFRIWNSASGTENPEVFDADAVCDFLSPTQGDEIVGKSVTVTGEPPVYTVVYDLDGKGTSVGGGALTQIVAFAGAAVDPEVAGNLGWTFREWDHSKRTDVRADVTYKAIYDMAEVPDAVVSFDANGGTGAVEPVVATFGKQMPEAGPAPTRQYADFDGYYDAPEGGIRYYNADMTSARLWDKGAATTLYAHWNLTGYPIIYAEVKEGAVNPNPPVYSVKEGIVFAALDDSAVVGYAFAGWSPSSIETGTTGEVVVTALWTKRQCTVVIGGEELACEYGDTITQTAPFADVTNGWTNVVCVGWTGTGDVPAAGTSAEVTFTVTKTSTLDWLYQTNYWFEASVLGEGAVVVKDAGFAADVTGCWVPQGAKVVIEASGDIEMFHGWRDILTGDIVAETAEVEILMDEPFRIVADFGVRSVTEVTLDANGGQSAGDTLFVTNGMALPAIAAAPKRTGYSFVGYADAKSGGTLYYGTDLRGLRPWDKEEPVATLYAQWTPNAYMVAFDAQGGSGSMDPLALTYDVRAQLPSCTFANGDMRFRGWSRTADGDVAFADEATVSNLSAEDGATVTLYAVWSGVPDGFAFEQSYVSAGMGSPLVFVIVGGNDAASTSVKLELSYANAKAGDLDLTNARIDGVGGIEREGLKFPLVLNWARGDMTPKTITIPTVFGKATDAPKYLTLNLTGAYGLPLAEPACCIGEIESGDAYTGSDACVLPYVENLAGGMVSRGVVVKAGKSATIKATASKGHWFAGWYDEVGAWASGNSSFTVSPSANVGLQAYEARFVEAQTALCGAYGGFARVNLRGMTLVKGADTSADVYGDYAFAATLTTAGKVSGSIMVGGKKVAFKGDACLEATEDEASFIVEVDEKAWFGVPNGETLLLTFGSDGMARLEGWSHTGDYAPLGDVASAGVGYLDVSKDKSAASRFAIFAGLYAGCVDCNDGRIVPLSVTINASGKVRVAGRFWDGTALSASGILGGFSMDEAGRTAAYAEIILLPKALGSGSYHLSLVAAKGENAELSLEGVATFYTAQETDVLDGTAGVAYPYAPGCWAPSAGADADLCAVTLAFAGETLVIPCTAKNGVITGLGKSTAAGVSVNFYPKTGVLSVVKGKEWTIQGVLGDYAAGGAAVGYRAADGTYEPASVSVSVWGLPEEVIPWTEPGFSLTAGETVGDEIQPEIIAPDGSTVTFALSGLPSGLKVDKASGVIVGAAKKAGSYAVNVSYTYIARKVTRTTVLIVR